MQTTTIDRFMDKVARADVGCWDWLASTRNGYGQFNTRADGRKVVLYAHRFAYELFVGPIPDGLTIDHLCANRLCVNPAHMEPVTRGENTARGFAVERATLIQRGKAHCPAGHRYDEANTYVNPAGRRECRACNRDKCRRYRARRA